MRHIQINRFLIAITTEREILAYKNNYAIEWVLPSFPTYKISCIYIDDLLAVNLVSILNLGYKIKGRSYDK
jgi:hypothetical protein